MMSSIWHVVLAGLLVACLASFKWGMERFFARPVDARPEGLKLLSICGSGFAVLHLAAIVMTSYIPSTRALIAASLYGTGLALFWWAIRSNRAHPLSAVFSRDLPEHLMDRGPYRFVRHPFYCSYLLTWIAGFVGTGQIWLLPTAAVMFAVYLRAAHLEEKKFTQSSLAVDYERYRSRTGLFLPNPIKLFGAQDSASRYQGECG